MKMKVKSSLLFMVSGVCVAFLARAQESKSESGQPAAAAPRTQPAQPGSVVSAQAQSVAVVVASPVTNTNEYKPSTDKDEAAACMRNLEKINAAIQAYRKDNQDVPNWVSDLVPEY